MCRKKLLLTFAHIFMIILLSNIAALFNFKTAKAEGFILQTPFNGSHPITSYFDHSSPDYTTSDGIIAIYTGESGSSCEPYCYNGHPGIDWSMGNSQIFAAASGIVSERTTSASGYGNSIVLEHADGMHTLYAHLQAIYVVEGQYVTAGDLIGLSGSTGNSTGPHLHFGVYKGEFTRQNGDESNATDPFGWLGDYPDPLLQYEQGHMASCLWRIANDFVSCFDTTIEDKGENFFIWNEQYWMESEIGNGWHMYFRENTAVGNNYRTEWYYPNIKPGIYQVRAWIPYENATTQQAEYGVWTKYGWEYPVINQQSYSDEWVTLGTFSLSSSYPSNNVLILMANTGEPTGTKWVGVDAIRLRSYFLHMPAILKKD